MSPPASDDHRLAGHVDFTPTINTFIEPPAEPKDTECAPPAPAPLKSCAVVDPLNALATSFGVGILIGALLVYAFSKPTIVQISDD